MITAVHIPFFLNRAHLILGFFFYVCININFFLLSILELNPVLRNLNALLSNILSCANKIQTFMFETINDKWEQFESDSCAATCVKTVTNAHMSFLESITKCKDDASAVSH